MTIPPDPFIDGRILFADQLNYLLDGQRNDLVDLPYTFGDGSSHPASFVLNVTTLAELQAYNGGIFSFATAINDEMDWLGIQYALYNQRYVQLKRGATYILNRTLEVPNCFSQINAWGATLNFQNLVAASPVGPELISNGDFAASGTDWSNTTLTPRTDVVFAVGTATFTDPAPGAGNSYGAFGQEVTIPAGRWRVAVHATLTPGASAGIAGPPYLNIDFFGTGVGTGTSTIDAGTSAGAEFDGDLTFDFGVEATTTAWLTIAGGNCDWVITSVSITPFLMNYAIFFNGDTTARTNVYEETVWTGGMIVGPATSWIGSYAGQQVGGVLCKSFNSADDGRANLREVHIRRFQYGITFSDQAFLNRIEGCTIGECFVDVRFLPGSQNAGENLRFTNCILFNSDRCIDAAGGAEWNFWGCSFDYSEQYVNASRGALLNFYGCHFESNPPTVAPKFVLNGASTITMQGGELFQAGDGTTGYAYYIDFEDTACKFRVDGVWSYGLSTGSGTLCYGPGLFIGRDFALNPTNAFLASMIARNYNSDVFGSMGALPDIPTVTGLPGTPADNIGFDFDVWADSGVVASRGVITATMQATRDTVYVRGTSKSLKLERLGVYVGQLKLCIYLPIQPGQIAFDEFYYGQPTAGAPIVYGPTAPTNPYTTVLGSNIVTVTDAGMAAFGGSGPGTGWTVTEGGSVTVNGVTITGVLTIIERTGTNTYTIAGSGNATVNGTGGGLRSLTYTQTNCYIYNRRFFVKKVGVDAYGRTLISTAQFAGEENIRMPITSASWTKASFTSWYTTPDTDILSDGGMGRAPAWATHWMIVIDANELPTGMALHLTDLYGNLV